MATFFSEYFEIDPEVVDEYGAFNISIVNDLPLFVDPFLLFNSEDERYRKLHDEIINYLKFLKDKALNSHVNDDTLRLWYCFPEVKQNWLGFSLSGNRGSGLGIEFAKNLHKNLHKIFSDFGEEKITSGSHLEKVCLIQNGIGRNNISDFTTNLIKGFLCEYTEKFASAYIGSDKIRRVSVKNVKFNYFTESWESALFNLPWLDNDYVLLTPKNILTRDENWINRHDLIRNFQEIHLALPDAQLRAQVSNYFSRVIAKPKNRYPNKKEREEAAAETLLQFPQLIDYFIKVKEDTGDEATDISSEKVALTEKMFYHQLRQLQLLLNANSHFYTVGKDTYEESHVRLAFLKDIIENKGGHKIFYDNGKSIGSEKDLQILFRLVWFGTPSDVTSEANDGRGPVDYKISRGASDKTLVEIKLARNTALQRNLEKQLPIYQAASDAKNGIKAIVFFTEDEKERAESILKKLGILNHRDVVMIDARFDNKPSGSKA